jgi:hypothetical protein
MFRGNAAQLYLEGEKGRGAEGQSGRLISDPLCIHRDRNMDMNTNTICASPRILP